MADGHNRSRLWRTNHGGFDNDPRHNLTERAIATALVNIESSRVAVGDMIHVLNHWR